MGYRIADWKIIKAEYIAGGTTYRKLAEKYGLSRSKLQAKATKENWVGLKGQAQAKTESNLVESISKQQTQEALNTLDKIETLTDKLLEKIEQAINELNVQLYKKVNKTKEIEYNNDKRPDKPTKETIHESEEVIEVSTIVDRSGLKAIASALRDIEALQRSKLDIKEQEARIAKLEREVGFTDDGENETGVVMLPNADAPLVDPEEDADE